MYFKKIGSSTYQYKSVWNSDKKKVNRIYIGKVNMAKLILPGIGESITVKITGDIENTGNKLWYCDCKIWGLRNMIRSNDGSEKENKFRLQITKSIWISLYQELKIREEMLFEECGNEKIDPELECVIGKIITITGRQIEDMAFYDGSYGKIFLVNIREDLEELERIGGNEFEKGVKTELEKCNSCIYRNINPIKKVKNVDTHGVIRLDSWS